MKTLCAWMVLGVCCVANAGEYQSVLVNKTEAPAVSNCCNKSSDLTKVDLPEEFGP